MGYSLWYNALTMLPATGCNTQSSAPEDGENNCPKHAELTGIINKLLWLHLTHIHFTMSWLRQLVADL